MLGISTQIRPEVGLNENLVLKGIELWLREWMHAHGEQAGKPRSNASPLV